MSRHDSWSRSAGGLLSGIVLMTAIGVASSLTVSPWWPIWLLVGPLDALLAVGVVWVWRDRRFSSGTNRCRGASQVRRNPLVDKHLGPGWRHLNDDEHTFEQCAPPHASAGGDQ